MKDATTETSHEFIDGNNSKSATSSTHNSRLVQCGVCNGKVSSTAKKCPHCGEENFMQPPADNTGLQDKRPENISSEKNKIELVKRTELEAIAIGGTCIFIGFVLCFFVITAIIGVPLIIYGFYRVMIPGKKNIAKCPNCESEVELANYVKGNTTGVDCPVCKERLIAKDGYVELAPHGG